MISGAVQNGEFEMGLGVYSEMRRNGLVPNELLLAVLQRGVLIWGIKNWVSAYIVLF